MGLERISRRLFLRGTGVAMALPMLDAMVPKVRGSTPSPKPIRRMVCINTTLGIHAENLFPEEAGKAYKLTPYLEQIADFRDQLTVFSGVSHPDVDGGHSSECSFLTAAPHPGASGFKNTISLDQFAAERIGSETRFASLTLGMTGRSISVSRAGIEIPPDIRPSQVFKKLFVDGSASEKKRQIQKLQDGRSIMDVVGEQGKSLQRTVGKRDQQTLEEYFTTVREVEQRLHKAEEWANKPKPKVSVPMPVDNMNAQDILGRAVLLFDLVQLAFQTDSTRLVTVALSPAQGVPLGIDGVTMEHHNLSHHGMDPEKLAQLRALEAAQMKNFGYLLKRLRDTDESGSNLLERSMVMYGSNLGNASSHSTQNMPIILAGGGFKHGQHLAFNRENNTPLARLFVSMLQRMGIEADSFASGTGTISGLEMASA